MGELGALFNPGMRHELEERRSKAARREEEGNARDGDLRIDLESGVAVINIPGADEDPETAADPQTATDPPTATGRQAHTDPGAARPTAGKPASTEDSVPSEERQPPAEVLKPRGKRGLSASPR
jgi:hypothetical protein